MIEVGRRGRPVARIVPLPCVAPRTADWSQTGNCSLAAYPTPVGDVTAAQAIVDGRGGPCASLVSLVSLVLLD